MPKKRTDSATTQSRDTTRTKRQKRGPAPFAYYPNDWKTFREFKDQVVLLKTRFADRGGPQLIVKKVLEVHANSANDPRPFEIRALALLPRCNRVVHALTCVASDEPNYGIALFEYYPLGDMAVWKNREFDLKNFKPVPESYIWRFFVQATQALAFLQNEIGHTKDRRPMLHRDIKPKNILVVDIGTTYPSFKIHDFGCALLWHTSKQDVPSFCGTYEWQPPENPQINTMAAEVWALGACVHFLATGQKPIEDTEHSRAAFLERVGQDPENSEQDYYSSSDRYVTARIPRRALPINLDAQTQLSRGITNQGPPNPQYSVRRQQACWPEWSPWH
ncbi:serine/threonine protein kinase-like protein [Boeremia exigua]|uniref:serine/threonine protein kinase-like protein n=1 Tax=Boeremia exigua TaxID=749465 RepID=UPI001E8DB6AC|nr:serine/threonine protein kinase-like protein [Boeremia exigua]KAH6637438.1 serine/threonine protein kinase-like protein [Boeremia exigua]